MRLTPHLVKHYHVFLASPGDVDVERRQVRRFFEEFNRQTAHVWNARFDVIDWENYATIGVGRAQELITRQTLQKYKNSLALVVGIMAQRFGSPTGKAESGTEEEFVWAMKAHAREGFPEIKFFFRKVEQLIVPAEPKQASEAVAQWHKVLRFRKRIEQDKRSPLFVAEYGGTAEFEKVFARDLNLWLNDSRRPWATDRAARAWSAGTAPGTSPLNTGKPPESVITEEPGFAASQDASYGSQDPANRPGSIVFTGLAGGAISALAITCWQNAGQQAGLVCALLLVPLILGFSRVVVREHPPLASYLWLTRTAVVVVFVSYLFFFPRTWKIVSMLSDLSAQQVSLRSVGVVGVIGLILGYAVLTLWRRARIGRLALLLFKASVKRLSGLLAEVGASEDLADVADAWRSTDRVSQVVPQPKRTDENQAA